MRLLLSLVKGLSINPVSKKLRKMKIKVNPFIIWIIGISLLISFAHSWGVCPEQPNDSGICDSLYVEVYPWDVFFTNPGHLARVLIRVTHDNPSTLDSIAGMVLLVHDVTPEKTIMANKRYMTICDTMFPFIDG